MSKPILFPDFDRTTTATLPNEKVISVEHTFVVDSRQRDCRIYPEPNFYKVNLGTTYKNITSIELKGSLIPRSSYNVHSTNQFIDFSIGSTITKFIIENTGSGYSNTASIVISPPRNSGTLATATLVVNYGSIVSVVITNPGSGYTNIESPTIYINSPTGKDFVCRVVVGTQYTTTLRHGQYIIGGNPTPPSVTPLGLLNEIQNAMNYKINGVYDPASIGPFEVRLVSQYPTLTATTGTPAYYNTNATQFNRIQITNTNSDYWELLFWSGPSRNKNASILMGFNSIDYGNPVQINSVITGSGTLFSAGTALRAVNDYDLLDDPKYVLLSFWDGSETFERLECYDSSINRKFGTIVFDANVSNVLKDTVGDTFTDSSNIEYLVGPIEKGPFWLPPGYLKAVKGSDLDQKKLEFLQPIGKLSSLTISFTKFGPSQQADPYDFFGKDHFLVFGVKANDNKSGQKA